MVTSIIWIKANTGSLDPALASTAAGVVEAATPAPRLASDGLTAVAWQIQDLDPVAVSALASELRSMFHGEATVDVVIITPAPDKGTLNGLQDTLQRQRNIEGFAQ